MFDELSTGSPPPTVNAVATLRGIPKETLRVRWKKYQRAVEEKDDNLLAIACGDVDGRRDNHRVFTREEEALLRAAIDQENVDPNKPQLQHLAISIHQRYQASTAPHSSTNTSLRSSPTFTASSGFVERIKRDLHLSSQKPKIHKRYKRAVGPEEEEKKEVECIEYLNEVERAVKRNGADFVINADEISAKMISPPYTLLAPTGGDHPPIIHSNHTAKEAFTMIFATTPSGKKLRPVVIISERGPRAMQAFAHLIPHVHFMMGHRWFGEEMWRRYIDEIIVPFCNTHPATFVVDSSQAHLTDLCVDAAMEHDIYTIQVPKGTTAVLQPNDVKVYGPLTSRVRTAWLNQIREEPEQFDSLAKAIERYLSCWRRLSRQTVQHAWKEAIPLLRGLRNAPGTAGGSA